MDRKKIEQLNKIWEKTIVKECLEIQRSNDKKRAEELEKNAVEAGFWDLGYQIAYDCREMLNILESKDEYDEYMDVLSRESGYGLEFYQTDPFYRIGKELERRERSNEKTA